MTVIRHLLVASSLAALTVTLTVTLTATGVTQSHPRTSLADPFYCVVVTDGNGHPIDTVCVPDPTGSVVVGNAITTD